MTLTFRIAIISFVLLPLAAFCQKNKNNYSFDCDSIASTNDCSNALTISALGSKEFDCTPNGYGSFLEIKNNIKSDSCYISREHNTIWLSFKGAFNGDLSFLIKPKNIAYDYDFMLYKVEKEDFCDQIINKDNRPIRSNKARNDSTINSITGLKINATNDFVNSGPGDNFSNTINTRRGDQFILIIDSYYPGKEGFYIEFKYYEFVTLTGFLLDKTTNKPISADLSWEDVSSGEVLATASNDSLTGKFTIKVPIDKQKPQSEYNLSSNAKNYFFTEQVFTGKLIKENKSKPISPMMDVLKVNDKIKLNNLSFVPNSSQYSPSALPTLRRIKKLLNTNPTLKIQIEGHTNGCPEGVESAQYFSEARANSVKEYLVQNGINENRISTIGYNCSKMLYPDENNPYHAKMNRRVEIVVTDL